MAEKRKLAVLMLRAGCAGVEEVDFSIDFCIRRTLRNLHDWIGVVVDAGQEVTAGDMLEMCRGAEWLLVVTDKEIVVPRRAAEVLLSTCKANPGAVSVPVVNEGPCAVQVADIPAPYHNFDNLEELAGIFASARGGRCQEVAAEETDFGVVLMPVSFMADMDPAAPFSRLAEELRSLSPRCVVAQGALIHRFGDYYGSVRHDLVELVPLESRLVLDIGCARGATGKALRDRLGPGCTLVGVEMNRSMAESAAEIYDRVLVGDVSCVDLPDGIDAAIMGDVLEHLSNPGAVLEKVAGALSDGGVLIGSVPNAGHWSIVASLLQGEFEYIPVGLTCVTHIRWFTERSLERLLGDAGLRLDRIERDMPPPLPSGEMVIAAAERLGIGDGVSLRTAELRFVARKVA